MLLSRTIQYIVRLMFSWLLYMLSFFFNDTATTEIYTLSLHDALPISLVGLSFGRRALRDVCAEVCEADEDGDRKSTRLNSSHQIISYAVFCLKKKKKRNRTAACQDRAGLPAITLRHLWLPNHSLSLYT